LTVGDSNVFIFIHHFSYHRKNILKDNYLFMNIFLFLKVIQFLLINSK
jgi:hypothetical protein